MQYPILSNDRSLLRSVCGHCCFLDDDTPRLRQDAPGEARNLHAQRVDQDTHWISVASEPGGTLKDTLEDKVAKCYLVFWRYPWPSPSSLVTTS